MSVSKIKSVNLVGSKTKRRYHRRKFRGSAKRRRHSKKHNQ